MCLWCLSWWLRYRLLRSSHPSIWKHKYPMPIVPVDETCYRLFYSLASFWIKLSALYDICMHTHAILCLFGVRSVVAGVGRVFSLPATATISYAKYPRRCPCYWLPFWLLAALPIYWCVADCILCIPLLEQSIEDWFCLRFTLFYKTWIYFN